MTAICIHCHVSGRVQGVFFRRYTCDKARALGVTGWVKNTEDGRVEVLACGERDSVLQLQTWLGQGPPNAEVAQVESTELPQQHNFKHFEVR